MASAFPLSSQQPDLVKVQPKRCPVQNCMGYDSPPIPFDRKMQAEPTVCKSVRYFLSGQRLQLWTNHLNLRTNWRVIGESNLVRTADWGRGKIASPGEYLARPR
jgi:hypothetical protein